MKSGVFCHFSVAKKACPLVSSTFISFSLEYCIYLFILVLCLDSGEMIGRFLG